MFFPFEESKDPRDSLLFSKGKNIWRNGMFFSPRGKIRASFLEPTTLYCMVKYPNNAILREIIVYFISLFDKC